MQGIAAAATLTASAMSSLVLRLSVPSVVAARPSSPKLFITSGVLERSPARRAETPWVSSRKSVEGIGHVDSWLRRADPRCQISSPD